jgi:hypothetical protein
VFAKDTDFLRAENYYYCLGIWDGLCFHYMKLFEIADFYISWLRKIIGISCNNNI